MPKYLGAPRPVTCRTYLDGKFKGKFAGDVDLEKSDLVHDVFYDLQFLDGEINAMESGLRHWREGESPTFRKLEPFPTKLLNPLNCTLRYKDGTEKYFKIELHEPKVLKPKLTNQVYEGGALFTTIEGRISGYITHYELAGTTVELPESRKATPVKSARDKTTDIKPRETDDLGITTPTAPAWNDRDGCFDSGTNGCLGGCAILFGILLSLAFLLGLLGWLVGLLRAPLVPGFGGSRPSLTQPANQTTPNAPVSTPSPGAGETPDSGAPDELNTDRDSVKDSDVGRMGTFNTNEHLRATPNMFATSTAIQFKGARFRVVEQENHVLSSGKNSKWYRVEIVEYGCDAENVLGCGKSSPDDSDNGWLNSKYVTLEK